MKVTSGSIFFTACLQSNCFIVNNRTDCNTEDEKYAFWPS